MKSASLTCLLLGGLIVSASAAPKFAVLDFDNEATASKNGVLAGGVTAADLSLKSRRKKMKLELKPKMHLETLSLFCVRVHKRLA